MGDRGHPRRRYKYIIVGANPDGSLYGAFRNHKGRNVSYVRAWRVDEVALAVEVRRTQLKPQGLAERADWFVQTSYSDFEVCHVEPGDVPRTCYDGAPAHGYQRHDL